MSAAHATKPAPLTRRTAFYARVTQEESVELSIPNQQKRFRELAETHGWDAELFVEPGPVHGEWSADRRPALRALLEAVDAGRVGRVVVRHLDRLGRGRVMEELIEHLSYAGVELHTFDGPVDLRSAAGRLGVRAQAMVGAFEVERTGERIREMKRQKARGGHYVGPTPFGYTSQARVRRELTPMLGEEAARRAAESRLPHRSILVVDEVEAAIVRRIFADYNAGKGRRAIAMGLSREGLRTRAGNFWRGQQINQIVKSPLYAGWVTFDEAAFTSARKAQEPVHRQTRYEGTHPAIIDRETWDRAEARWSQNKSARCPPSRSYALGAITCRHGHRGGGRSCGGVRGRLLYVCNPRMMAGPDPTLGGCDVEGMPVDTAEAMVADALRRMLAQPELLLATLHQRRRDAARAEATPSADRKKLEAELAAKVRERERVLGLVIEAGPGSAAATALLAHLGRVEEACTALTTELAKPTTGQVIALPAPVTLAEVEAFTADLSRHLATGPNGLPVVVDALRARHGLQIVLDGDHQLRVELSLDLRGDGRAVPVVWRMETVQGPSIEDWLAEAQASAPLCACGCGEQIVVQPVHRFRGLPQYRNHHNPLAIEDFVRRCNEEGLVTVNQAADILGVGRTGFRRSLDRRGLPTVTRTWGPQQQALLLIPRVALESVAPKPLTLPLACKALGITQTRLLWLHERGVVPEPRRSGNGRRVYGAEEIEQARALISSWEEEVFEELRSEGWMVRQEALSKYGVACWRMTGWIEAGEVRAEWRKLTSDRATMVVLEDDVRRVVAVD